MPGEFSNKVAVVTGGSRGIGREIAVELARAGAQTVIVSSSADNLASAAKTIASAGLAPLTITADLRTLEGCQQAFDEPDQAWIDGYALKLFGCVRMCRLFWPLLKAAQGSIVSIGGGAARSPGADFSIGASVNAAMGNFSKALSQLGKRDGVSVNVIHPGATETERFYQLLEQRSKASGKSIEQLKQEATAKDGLRRLGKPADIAALALFLCSEKAQHIQGTAIAVDGGSTVGYY